MLKIDGVDFTEYVMKYGAIETPRRIVGPNAGTAMDGTYIEDLITIKYDLAFVVKPLRPDMLAQLIAACSPPYVNIEYQSGVFNGLRTGVYCPSPSSVEFLTVYAQQGVYGNLTLNFTEK